MFRFAQACLSLPYAFISASTGNRTPASQIHNLSTLPLRLWKQYAFGEYLIPLQCVQFLLPFLCLHPPSIRLRSPNQRTHLIPLLLAIRRTTLRLLGRTPVPADLAQDEPAIHISS